MVAPRRMRKPASIQSRRLRRSPDTAAFRRFLPWLALSLLPAFPVAGEFQEFSIPGDETWKSAFQTPASFIDTKPAEDGGTTGVVDDDEYLQTFDFERFPGAIVPIDPVRVIPVPVLPLDVAADGLELTAEQTSELQAFARYLAKSDVLAQTSATLSTGEAVSAGDVVLPRLSNFPRDVAGVQDLLRAGVTQCSSLVNVADAFPRGSARGTPPNPGTIGKYNKLVNITSPSQYETDMRIQVRNIFYGNMLDGDPMTSFPRVDERGRDVKQRLVFMLELGRYWPINLIRFYPTPGSNLSVASYRVQSGVAHSERDIPGLRPFTFGNPGFPEYNRMGDAMPLWQVEQAQPVNRQDTAAVIFTPPRPMRFFRIDVDTPLGYDIAEIEAFADGFLPEASYTTRPLALPPASLGQIVWEEEKIGEPTKSWVEVFFQVGFQGEPLVLFRITEFNDIVEWIDGDVQVVDRRLGSPTRGRFLNINDETLRPDARAIFNALRPEERFAIRIKRDQYLVIVPDDQAGVEPDLELWSGFQPVDNGGFIRAPANRDNFQLRIDFYSNDPTAATIVRNLRFEYDTPPPVLSATGEIAPAADVAAGIDTSFVLALRARLADINTGFNRLHVRTPALADVRAVEIDRHLGGGLLPLTERVADDGGALGDDEYQVLTEAANYFVVALPDVRPSQADSVSLRVRFGGRVLGFTTDFRSHVFHDTLGVRDSTAFLDTRAYVFKPSADTTTLAYLRVEDGDVADLATDESLEDRNSLGVAADISRTQGLLDNLRLSSPVITPNGDGRNDDLMISFDLLRLTEPRAVEVAIYDLSGRRVALVDDDERKIGGYIVPWSGTYDGTRDLVPPGIYLIRIRVEADDAEATLTRSVAVAY